MVEKSGVLDLLLQKDINYSHMEAKCSTECLYLNLIM